MYAMEKALKRIEETYKDWNQGKLNQGQALTKVHSEISILERCVNKCNTPGNGVQSSIFQKEAHKKHPDLEILSLNLKIEV